MKPIKISKLLDEIWYEEIKPDIESCFIIKDDKFPREDCESECDLYPICKKLKEYQSEGD